MEIYSNRIFIDVLLKEYKKGMLDIDLITKKLEIIEVKEKSPIFDLKTVRLVSIVHGFNSTNIKQREVFINEEYKKQLKK